MAAVGGTNPMITMAMGGAGAIITAAVHLAHGKQIRKRLRAPWFHDPEGPPLTIADKAS
jgi:hypothetical protein